ncbi:hypothetical protein LH442_11820 [Laribacter hongkongensis]|uniref:hypothetical protein n=1 Tax=Laribacter hongkongensis TaxID=168471 RepID=UPI001EFEA20D|nr:hypothetical protein [Laribacter hongkongensis]MCG9056657.1 hypothetical protein [Laribacter hongkongensis]
MPPQTIHPALPILACVLRSGRAARSQDRMTGIPEASSSANDKNIFLNTGNRIPATVIPGKATGHLPSRMHTRQPASRSVPKGPH